MRYCISGNWKGQVLSGVLHPWWYTKLDLLYLLSSLTLRLFKKFCNNSTFIIIFQANLWDCTVSGVFIMNYFLALARISWMRIVLKKYDAGLIFSHIPTSRYSISYVCLWSQFMPRIMLNIVFSPPLGMTVCPIVLYFYIYCGELSVNVMMFMYTLYIQSGGGK